MEKELKRDIVDGKIIDWSKLSQEELTAMKKELEKKEEKLLNKINKELNDDEK